MTAIGTLNEANTIQAGLIDALQQTGCIHIPGDQLPRIHHDVLIEPWVRDAIRKHNPDLTTASHIDTVWEHIQRLLLAGAGGALLPANEAFHNFITVRAGTITIPGLPEGQRAQHIRLIDFEHPDNNRLVVADEVTFIGTQTCRFDLVLYINGIPLVIIELKSPVSNSPKATLHEARIQGLRYIKQCPQMYIPNLMTVLADGHEVRYGSITTTDKRWPWWRIPNSEFDLPPFARCVTETLDLTQPARVLDILHSFVLYRVQEREGGRVHTSKLLPRPIQVPAVHAILDRVADPDRKTGLVVHYQGSGKTFTMAYAAAAIYRDYARFHNPLILLVLDRRDLLSQLKGEFKAAGLEDNDGFRIVEAESVELLRKHLSAGYRGVLVTCIQRFAHNIDALDPSPEAVVMIDEAHRTQEGSLGRAMRAALPNATMIGFTGTPVESKDRDTYDFFGHPGDPGRILSRYDMGDSIDDGVTLPLRILPCKVDNAIDQLQLDDDFLRFAAQEDLDDEVVQVLSTKVSTHKSGAEAILGAPAHINAVCSDVADHFVHSTLPRRLKAQLVVYNRRLCLLYEKQLRAALDARAPTTPRSGW